jgi:integrase
LTLTASLMGEYMERWLEGPLKRSVATSTYEDYVYRTRKYVIPALGNTKLKDLTAEHLDGLYEQKSASDLSPRSVNFIHSMICVALRRAVKKRLIPYNVARDAEPPKQVRREYTTLSREQLGAFFRVAAEAEDRFEALFIITGALAGLRPGELLGLKWNDLKLPEEGSAKLLSAAAFPRPVRAPSCARRRRPAKDAQFSFYRKWLRR